MGNSKLMEKNKANNQTIIGSTFSKGGTLSLVSLYFPSLIL